MAYSESLGESMLLVYSVIVTLYTLSIDGGEHGVGRLATITFVNCAAFVPLDFKIANTVVASIVHCKLDYCNSLCFNLPKTQINRLQHIQKSLARTVANTSKYSQSQMPIGL